MLGTKILETKNSKFNGRIEVVRSLGWGTYIQVEGLTQSGGVVDGIWKITLKKIKNKDIKSCLILGLGGGSVAKLVNKTWPGIKITGIDIDPVMIEMGEKYLGLNKIKLEKIVGDANEFIQKLIKKDNKFDLVIIDLYKGHSVPEEFNNEEFPKQIKKIVTENGLAIFNRLYDGEARSRVVKFGLKLQKVYPKVDYFYPEANLMFICYSA